MVDTILIIACILSLIIWFVQEKKARPQQQQQLNGIIATGQQLPADIKPIPIRHGIIYLNLLLRFGLVGQRCNPVKDDDFAFILVMLTFYPVLLRAWIN